MIRFKNTLTRKIEEFRPIEEEVRMYNCGPTVYNFSHIGNLRAYIFADLIKSALEMNNFKVKQVINITDVGHLTDDADEGEDKVEKRAREENLKAEEISQEVTDKFVSDLEKLKIDTSKIIFPKATDHIPEQIDLIKELEKKDFTYKISDGIYFDTSKFSEYGKLGGIDLSGLEEGARVEKNKEKKSPTDFALWKFSGDQKRQQEWESPWGIGFPGWHLECSAMSRKYLGKTFDIHTGGIDHIGTHHNNEIAQSESANESSLANYWLHVNYITIDGEKISKSLGNTVYIDDLIEKGINPISYKYWLYQSSYSTLTNFTWESLKAAQTALYKIYSFLEKTENAGEISDKYYKDFESAINYDLDTPRALATLWTLMADDEISDEDKKATLLEFDKVLKLNFNEPNIKEEIPTEIIELAQKRQDAREAKDFNKSDEIRDQIQEKGYEIKDNGSDFELKRLI